MGFYRPIITGNPDKGIIDADIDLIRNHFEIDVPYKHMYGYTAEEAGRLISKGRDEELLEGIIDKYNMLKKQFEFILCEGTDFVSATAAFEFDINGEVSKNLGSPVLIVANAFDKTIDDTLRSIELAVDSLKEMGCYTIGTIVNRVVPDEKETIINIAGISVNFAGFLTPIK